MCFAGRSDEKTMLRKNTEQSRTFIASTIKIVILPLSRQRIPAVVRMSDPLAGSRTVWTLIQFISSN